MLASVHSPTMAEEYGDTFGDGVAAYSLQDYADAARIWSALADAGHVDAAYRLAGLYELGLGVETDTLQALHYYALAAGGGHTKAAYEMGAILANGRGVDADPAAAVPWYTQAAEAGHGRAQYALATLYLTGSGVAVDYPEAYYWYSRAVESLGDSHEGQIAAAAVTAVAEVLPACKRDEIDANLRGEQVAEPC